MNYQVIMISILMSSKMMILLFVKDMIKFDDKNYLSKD